MNRLLLLKEKEAMAMFRIITFVLIAFSLIWSNNVSAQVKLKKKLPDLCYECHKELKENLADKYTHFLFKQGKCITCHNSHLSSVKGLMNDEVDSICLGCHEKIRNLLNKATLHSALRDGECPDCHYPHSGSIEHLLTAPEKMRCLNCHENIKDEQEKTYACLPFKEGKCSSCHNSHASIEEDLLNSASQKLCQKCHAPKCKAGDVSISSVVKNLPCTSCHSGHSSKDKGVLGPYGHTVFLIKKCEECHNPIEPKKKITTKLDGKELCFSCHKQEDLKYKYLEDDVHVKGKNNPCNICHDYHASGKKNLTKNEAKICISCHEITEKRTASMEKVLRSIKCTPIKERRCFECHIPTHSDLPLNYREDGIALCARCHASQHKITHPLGEGVIDPRDGKEVTCISCHSMHNAKDEFMLTFDRNRALCIQCHKM